MNTWISKLRAIQAHRAACFLCADHAHSFWHRVMQVQVIECAIAGLGSFAFEGFWHQVLGEMAAVFAILGLVAYFRAQFLFKRAGGLLFIMIQEAKNATRT